jgi:hypothetical protein
VRLSVNRFARTPLHLEIWWSDLHASRVLAPLLAVTTTEGNPSIAVAAANHLGRHWCFCVTRHGVIRHLECREVAEER